MEQADNLKNLT